MGLTFVAGLLGGEAAADPEARAFLTSELAALNRVLARQGLPDHVEPPDAPSLALDLLGQGPLHALRRAGAHLAAYGRLPEPAGPDAADDPVLQAYYARTGLRRGGLWGRLSRKATAPLHGFDHLILHSDCEGYYLPRDLPAPLPADPDELSGGDVGSALRLEAECRRIAQALGLPEDLTPEAPLLLAAFEGRGARRGWERYGQEALACCRLLHVCQHARETGTVIQLT